MIKTADRVLGVHGFVRRLVDCRSRIGYRVRYSVLPFKIPANQQQVLRFTIQAASLCVGLDCSDEGVDASSDVKVRNTISNAAVVISAPGTVMIRPYGVPSRFGKRDPMASIIGPKLAHAGNKAFASFGIVASPCD